MAKSQSQESLGQMSTTRLSPPVWELATLLKLHYITIKIARSGVGGV